MPSAANHKRLVITGTNGFWGWHLCRRARSSWTVFGRQKTVSNYRERWP